MKHYNLAYNLYQYSDLYIYFYFSQDENVLIFIISSMWTRNGS